MMRLLLNTRDECRSLPGSYVGHVKINTSQTLLYQFRRVYWDVY